MRLSEEDYKNLEKCFIYGPDADAAGLQRLPAHEGAERMGVKGAAAADCSGILFPYSWPGVPGVYGERLRLDHPPIDLRTGRPANKYLCPPGQRNHAYLPLEDPADLQDVTREIWIGEGEKKYLALRRAAREGALLRGANGPGPVKTLAMVMTFPGCWGFRGQVGIATDASGHRVPEKGIIPDLDKIAWKGRRVVILYDSNTATNEMVRASRKALARELESRGAIVWWVDILPEAAVNGPDDFLGLRGLPAFLELLTHAVRYDWRHELTMTDKGKIQASMSNAVTALSHAPAWNGVLAFNEFALRAEAHAPTPWGGPPGPWKDNDDVLTVIWLERQGIKLSRGVVADAVQAVAREHPFHPVREYLNSLYWDRTGRLDDWLTLYLSAAQTDYHRAVGARWMISAVARARDPGCKCDCALILESGQGLGKSTAFDILGGPFYSDDIAELGSKDASLGAAGAWIIELSELSAITRAEAEKIKSFLSRRIDRFRPPYGRHIVEAPRQSVFCGTVNLPEYLKDETGGRRFWPVQCGEILRLEELRRDRNQLWAEAVVRFERGERWWLDSDDLIQAATKEQDKRFQAEALEALIAPWLLNRVETTTAEILIEVIRKEPGQWKRDEEMRIGAILRHLEWERGPRSGPGRRHIYRPKAEKHTMQFKIAFKGDGK